MEQQVLVSFISHFLYKTFHNKRDIYRDIILNVVKDPT